MSEQRAEWEVEIRIRRNGRLQRRENAIGPDPLTAFDNAANDLIRDLSTSGSEQ